MRGSFITLGRSSRRTDDRRKYVTEQNRDRERERERGRKGASGISRSFPSGTVRLDLNHSGKDIGNGHAIALPPSAEIWLVPRNRSIPEASSRARPLDQVALARAPISRSGVVGIGSFSRENRASRCADCRAFYANVSSNIRVWRACTAIRDPDFSRDGRSFRVYSRHLARAFLRSSENRLASGT